MTSQLHGTLPPSVSGGSSRWQCCGHSLWRLKLNKDISLKRTRFEDRGIGPGGSDYLGWVYELDIAERTYGLRAYDDEPGRIAFMDVRMPGESKRGPIRGPVPYTDAVFARGARWLLETGEYSVMTVLCSDPEYPNDAYVPVDPDRLVRD